MESIEVRTDDQNQYSWDTIRTTFVDGVLSDRQVSFDNGTFAQTSYFDGIRAMMTQRDAILNGGVKAWDTIDTYYAPDGTLVGRVTVFDNGVLKEEAYENGVRREMIQMDNPQQVVGAGAKSWDSIVTYYDASGDIAARITQYDNGVLKEESFENGVRSHTRQVDNPQETDGDGVKIWEEIDSYYNASGTIVARVTKYDNGIFKEESFENGVRSHTRQIDNPQEIGGTGVKAWDTIDQYFDETGEMVARVIHYDDGRVRQDTYENGVRSTTEIQDGAYEGDEGAYAWTSINLYYDENGDVAQKNIVYDDGRVRQDDYVDGVKVSSTVEDRFIFNGGNHDWDAQQFQYNADGSVASHAISYDNGDAMLQVYEDGVLAQRVKYDGDGSDSWLGQIVTYNSDGSVASNETYDSSDELPIAFYDNSIQVLDTLI